MSPIRLPGLAMPLWKPSVPYRLIGACLILTWFAAAGCGSARRPEPARADVSGTVTLDGKPLPAGEITFLALSGEAAITLAITNGGFAGAVSVGPQRVQVASFKTVKRSIFPDKPPVEGRENSLPAAYGADSTLTATIQPGPNPPLTFELTSSPKKPATPGR